MKHVRMNEYTWKKWEMHKIFSRRIEREEATLDIGPCILRLHQNESHSSIVRDVDWIHPAQDRTSGMCLVNSVMKFHISWKAENTSILTTWVMASSSGTLNKAARGSTASYLEVSRSDLGTYTSCPDFGFLNFLIATDRCQDIIVKEVMIVSLRIPSSYTYDILLPELLTASLNTRQIRGAFTF